MNAAGCSFGLIAPENSNGCFDNNQEVANAECGDDNDEVVVEEDKAAVWVERR